MDLKTYVVGDVGTVAGLALAAVGLVWLIACANASNLLIARVTSRRRELAVRAALGASRGRVMRYLLAESSLLALGSAAIGMAARMVGIGVLRDAGAVYFPRTQEIALSGPVLVAAAALTMASVLLFGLVPAMQRQRRSASTNRCALGPIVNRQRRSVRRVRRMLVGGQFAIATPLLVVAGLLLVSLNELGRVDLGFDTHNLLTGSIVLPRAQYPSQPCSSAFWDELEAPRAVAARACQRRVRRRPAAD